MPLRIGIIGAGAILTTHLNAIRCNPDYRLIAICDLDVEKVKPVAAKLGIMAFRNYHDLLAEPLDVVAIILPHYLHAQVAMEAFSCGCHVLLEKPIALSMEEIRNMLAAARRSGRVLFPMESAYADPSVLRARDIVRRGDLGRFVCAHVPNHRHYFTSERPGWFLRSATSGGGQFINIGVHRIARTRAILGDEAEECSVLASVARMNSSFDIETCTHAMIRYATGATVTYEEFGSFPSPNHLRPSPRLIFARGMLGWDGDQLWTSDTSGTAQRHVLPASSPLPYSRLYAEAANAICGLPHYPTALHAGQDVRIALAAYASAESGRVIDLHDPEWQLV